MSDEAADRDETFVVGVEELGQVVYRVLVQALQVIDSFLEADNVNHFGTLIVERLNCLLETSVVHLKLFCFHFDIHKALFCDLLVKLSFELRVHKSDEVCLADLLHARLVPEVLLEHVHVLIRHRYLVFIQRVSKLFSTQPAVFIRVILVEHGA